MEDPTDNDPDQMDVDVKVEAEGPSDEMSLWKRLHDCVVSKQSAESLRHNFENEISASYEEIQRFLKVNVKIDLSFLKCLKGMVRILLICGDKHIAHTDTILTRYQDVLKEIVAMIGAESEVIMIEAVFDIWQRSVHRIGLLLTLLMTKQWISSEGLIRWAFQKMQNDPEIDEETMEVLWHVIQNGIQFAESLVKDAENEKADAAIQVEYAKQRAHDAATQAALAASHVEYGTGDDVQSMLNAINEANQAEENARKELKEAENALQSMDGSHVQTAMDFFRRTLLEVLEIFHPSFILRFLGASRSFDAFERKTRSDDGRQHGRKNESTVLSDISEIGSVLSTICTSDHGIIGRHFARIGVLRSFNSKRRVE